MRASLTRIMLLSAATVLFGVLLAACGARPAHAAPATGLDPAYYQWLYLPIAFAALALFSKAAKAAAVYFRARAEASKAEVEASKAEVVARKIATLMDTLASGADGIAFMLGQHPPAPADVLQAVRQAAVAQTVKYAKERYEQTIALVGISEETLAQRLNNAIDGALLRAGATRPATVP